MIKNATVIINDEKIKGAGTEISPFRHTTEVLDLDGNVIAKGDLLSFSIEEISNAFMNDANITMSLSELAKYLIGGK